MDGIEWLEGYLRSYPGAVVAISHDRRFLDNVAQRILELEACDLTEYRGGYSDYMRQKEERLLVYERTYDRQQQEVKKQMSFIRWALATQQEKRVRAAKSRLKLQSRLKPRDRPSTAPVGQRRKMNIRFQPLVRGGIEILEFSGVGKRYGDKGALRGPRSLRGAAATASASSAPTAPGRRPCYGSPSASRLPAKAARASAPASRSATIASRTSS